MGFLFFPFPFFLVVFLPTSHFHHGIFVESAGFFFVDRGVCHAPFLFFGSPRFKVPPQSAGAGQACFFTGVCPFVPLSIVFFFSVFGGFWDKATVCCFFFSC